MTHLSLSARAYGKVLRVARTIADLDSSQNITADHLSDIRHQLASWLQSAAVPDEQVADIVLSVNEACANSIEHGYRARKPGKVRIDGENDGARVHLKVTDGGSWKTASIDPGARGRGLLLIRAVSDWLEMDCTPSGTTVDMSFNLPA